MDRRSFLSSLLAAGSWPALSWADVGSPAFLAAARLPDGNYALFGLSSDGRDMFRIPLPGRGHAAAAHPARAEAVAFARRPGTFALIIDCAAGKIRHAIEAPEGRHFYGHGAFAQNGALLVTTENDIATGAGRLGLWECDAGYRRVGEVASGGVGPHDILDLEDGTLIVANGGIRTHPDHGRVKLNIDRMRPNLSYVSLEHGMLEVVELPPELHKASIRHLDHQEGITAFAMQWQGELPDSVPLLGLHKRGAAPVLCQAPMAEQLAMDGYAGSVAIMGDRMAITSPRGGRAHIFDLHGRFQTAILRRDICGATAGPSGIIFTDGAGGMLNYQNGQVTPMSSSNRNWDNHIVAV